MARRSAKAARKKDAKRQRAADKRAERARTRNPDPAPAPPPPPAGRRLLLLRDAVVKGETPAPRGLLNLGNTCFFNAVMQNLTRVAAFRDYFVGTPPCPAEGPMTSALRAFLIAMWDLNTSSIFDPSDLFTEVGKTNPAFKERAQQDSHELMRLLFDAVIEEEKKRLTEVARGNISPFHDIESTDELSESDSSPITTSEGSSEPPSSSDSTFDQCSQVPSDSLSDVEPNALPLPPPPAESEPNLFPLNSPHAAPSLECPAEDSGPEEEIPAEKLISIIDRAVGGVLSSTIQCKECGTKSSVVEPFLDLQLPLVPRDESEAKLKLSETMKGKAAKAAACLKLQRSDNTSKAEVEQEAKSEIDPSETRTATVATVPTAASASPPPPPPPPLPAPPRRPPPVATAFDTTNNCDVMRQLRETVIQTKPESVEENRMVIYAGDAIAANVPTDTEALFDDDDDSEECGFISSLFEDELDETTDSALDDINNMNAFSTTEAAKNTVSQPSSSCATKKVAASPPPARKTSSFISSLFGGLGGVSAAPHGYRSVVGSLEEFTKVEVLEGDNAYGCDECTRRERLRAALESRSKFKTVVKKAASTSQTRTHARALEQSAIGDSPHEIPTISRDVNRSTLSTVDGIVAEVGKTGTEVLMSSPVTSSESSSGVSSEDDGELVIEEELETPHVQSNKINEIRQLTREEEDEIIKQFDVKIPSVRTTAEKRLLIREAPDVLALQLKRFTQVGYRGGLRKISGHVDYPLSLDMTPFIDEAADDASEEAATGKKPDVAKRKRSSHETCEKQEKYEYLLTGIVVHGGSLSGGHYTAYVREGVEANSRGGWYLCNDSKISRASEQGVLNSEAYLLYYERVNV